MEGMNLAAATFGYFYYWFPMPLAEGGERTT